MKATKPTDYFAIELWGRYLGSQPFFWKNEQKKAFATGAPIDAIFQNREHPDWSTVSGLDAGHRFAAIYLDHLEANHANAVARLRLALVSADAAKFKAAQKKLDRAAEMLRHARGPQPL